MKGRPTLLGALVVVLLVLAVLMAGCGGPGEKTSGSSEKAQRPYAPNIDPADFVSEIDNKYFPLKPGTTFVYEGKSAEGTEHIEVTVTHETKQIMGVPCIVVRDRDRIDGKLAEDTFDWYAQDKEGNVWYFGEDTKEYENGKVVSTEGSWEAGVDGARPGIIMPADPKAGETYRQEYYKGEAEDMAKVLSLDESATVAYGSLDHLLMTKDWNPLEPAAGVSHKYYAPGVGKVLEVYVKGPSERLELVDIKKASRAIRSAVQADERHSVGHPGSRSAPTQTRRARGWRVLANASPRPASTGEICLARGSSPTRQPPWPTPSRRGRCRRGTSPKACGLCRQPRLRTCGRPRKNGTRRRPCRRSPRRTVRLAPGALG
jgi:hypothetical protein